LNTEKKFYYPLELISSWNLN